tara:strand:- start:76 stop:519 length:444 start_codon:yes stop_codon:yes gene_type:complete
MDVTRWSAKDADKIFDAVNRYSIGLDDIFHRLHSYGMTQPGGQYPPYNIIKDSNVKWRIELALAGWSKDDIEVSLETNVLLVRSKAAKETMEQEYLHRGVATRTFARGFNLSDDVRVGDVKFVDGMLTITLERVIPDHQKLQVFDIN